jgi:uncharacterized protein YbjT (DUF2867 family)
MTKQRVIAVVGATGAQGGGLARSILADAAGPFAVRGITRDPNKARAEELAAAGAQIVRADLDDEQTLRRAFAGAYGVFALTNYWEHFSADKEIDQAANIARAAKHAGVEHLIWSTLEDTRRFIPLDDGRMPTLQGHYKVPHFDAKEAANGLFSEAGVPTTFLYTAFYWENFIYFGMGPQRGCEGTLTIGYPLGAAKLPGIAAEDIGKVSHAIFRAGGDYIGKSVYIAGEHLTGAELAAALSRALSEEVTYHDLDPDLYRSLGFPAAEELGNMFQFKRDFETVYVGARDLNQTRQLHPQTMRFDAWLAANKDRIPLRT